MADISQDVVTFTKNGNMSNIEPGDTLALNFQRIQGRFDAMKSLAYQDKLAADDFDPSVTYPANFVNNNGLRTFRDKPSAFELALKDDILINRLQFLTPTKVEVCYDTVTYEEFTGSFNNSGMVDMLIEGKAAGWTVPDGTYGIKLYFTATEAMTLSNFFLNIDTHGEHSFSLTLQKSGSGQTDISTCTWTNIYTKPEINTDGYAMVTHEPFEWSPDESRFICVTIGDIYPNVDVPSALPVIYEADWYGASPKGQRKPYHQDRNQNVVFDKPVILPEGSDVGDFVKFVPQSLTDSQKAYARDNIDAASETHTHDGYASSVHTHNASDIVQDSTHKFVTDAQKEQWSAKAEANHIHTGYASSSHTHGAADITQDSTHRFVTDTEKTSWNSKADLVDGKVPASQLPSFVDDVLEYANLASFPTTGESGKIYVALNDNKTYRWSGTEYVVISDTIALGETAQTAYRGDHGKFAYDHAQNSDVHVTATQKDYWSSKAEGDHVHPISEITSLQAELNGKASTDHIHGYTEISGLMAQLNSKASSDHTHTGYAASGHTHSYNDLTDKPTIPEAVTVDSALSDTSENPIQNKAVKAALDGKAGSTHSHAVSDITGLETALEGVGCEKIIKTQAQFNALVASNDWLGAKSVVFSGQFEHFGPITIPMSVGSIRGVNDAMIAIMGTDEHLYFGWNSDDDEPNFPGPDKSISNITLMVNNTGYWNAYGFLNCQNVTNCTCYSYAKMNAYAFKFCKNVTNCKGQASSSEECNAIAFDNCENVVSCYGKGTSSEDCGSGFYECKGCHNCTGEASAELFYGCEGDPYTCEGIGGILVINSQEKFTKYMETDTYPYYVNELWIVGEYTTTHEIVIPEQITKIKGIGGAKITFTSSGKFFVAFSYVNGGSDNKDSVEELTLVVNATVSESGYGYVTAFENISYLDHCKATMNVIRTGSGLSGSFYAYAFNMCYNNRNCVGEVNITGTGEMDSNSRSYAIVYNGCRGVICGIGDANVNLTSTDTTGYPEACADIYYACQRLFGCMGTYTNTSNIDKENAVFDSCNCLIGCTEATTGQENVYSNCTNVIGCIGATAS